MNRSRLVPLGFALLCITSLGVVGTTLDSSLSTDPADEIDLDYDRLPIGTSDAATIREEVEGGDDADTVSEQQFEEVESAGGQATPPTLLERLLALFEYIVRFLLPIGAMMALLALMYYYRERLLEILRAATATDDGEIDSSTAADSWPGVEPSNPVDQAWLWMVRSANPQHPETKTPGECATIACEAGIDPTIVEAITDAFERVHYGGVPVEREAARSQAALKQVRDESRRRSDGGRQRHHGGRD